MPSVRSTFPNEFATPEEDLNDGDTITFVDAGNVEMSEKYGREQLIIRVKLKDGNEKKLSVNKTSAQSLSEKYGDDTDQWVGKQAVAEITKQNVGGKVKFVVYLKPIGE